MSEPDGSDALRDALVRAVPEEPEPAVGAIVAAARRRRSRRVGVLAGGAAIAAVVAIVGSVTVLGSERTATAPPPTGPSPSAPVLVQDGDVVVSCGGGAPGWPTGVMADGVPGLLSEAEARATFRAILADPEVGVEASLSLFEDADPDEIEWRVLRGDDRQLTVGLGRWTGGGPTRDAMVLDLSDEEGRWVADGWGSCSDLSPVLATDDVWVDVDGYRGAADALTLTLTERQCAGGRDPDRYLREPLVIESDDTVVVYATSEPAGRSTCQGNPSGTREVRLDRPLGDRVVLDGSSWPPEPVTGPAPGATTG